MTLVHQVLDNQYRVDAFVAAGGMGTVYRVWDLKRNVPLAMKVLHGELAEDPSVFKFFQREARALKKLAHPNIVPFYGLFRSDEVAFLLERFIDGPTLKQILKQRGGKPLPEAEALPYMKALSSALGYAHAHGVVHCDVKPGNVMVDRGGAIYLTDFGVARHADSTVTTLGFAGTAAYMAPEQCRGEAVTAQTDVYALGVMLFEMLTGRRPFTGNEPGAQGVGPTLTERIRHAHLNLNPPNPQTLNPKLSPAMAQVILTALAKRPQDRQDGVRELYEAVCAAQGVGMEALPDHTTLPPALWSAKDAAPTGLQPEEIPYGAAVGAAGEAVPIGTAPAPQARRKLAIGGGMAIIAGGALVVLLLIFMGKGDRSIPTTPTEFAQPTVAATSWVATEAAPPSPIPTIAPTIAQPTEPTVIINYHTLGHSAGGRRIELAEVGYLGDRAIVVVGSIDGTQTDTREAVNDCIEYYASNQSDIPSGTTLFFVPTINPDGNASNSRLNAHQVDLNRNWQTGDWTPNPPLPGYPNGLAGAGGSQPFSEPETQALRDLILDLKFGGKQVVVVVFHSSVRRSSGEVYAGYTASGSHHASESLTLAVAQILGYSYEVEWGDYDTPGNVVEWTAEQGIPSVDIVWPKNDGPSAWELHRVFAGVFE
ncbi:MAG: DUF2817 domain-containing protein [Anaerolineales bacterium]